MVNIRKKSLGCFYENLPKLINGDHPETICKGIKVSEEETL
jgi:hypothetical protein